MDNATSADLAKVVKISGGSFSAKATNSADLKAMLSDDTKYEVIESGDWYVVQLAEDDDDDTVTTGESETVSFSKLSADVKEKMTAALSNAGITDTTKILDETKVTEIKSDDLKTKSKDIYETLTSADKLTETLSKDLDVKLSSDTLVTFGTFQASEAGYVVRKNTSPKKFDLSKLLFFFVRLSKLGTTPATVQSVAYLAATGDAIEAVLMNASGDKLAETGELAAGTEFYAVPSEELAAGEAYAMVAGEKAEGTVSSTTEYTLTTATTSQDKAARVPFASGYTDVEVLGVFKASADEVALVSLDTKAFTVVVSQSVYFVNVSTDTGLILGDAAKLLSSDKNATAAIGSIASYAQSTTSVVKDATYALVKVIKSSSIIRRFKFLQK